KTLRAKLGASNPDLSPTKTHRGMGYRLRGG
ncbi:two-component system response regulator CreB, partial [Salmonella enterica]